MLNERLDVLPFFLKRHDLSILISCYFPNIKLANKCAHEFEIYGDFIADLLVGNYTVNRYLLVEFEDGRPDSIFKSKAKRATPEWAPRFECAYSQIVDWLWKLEDMRSTLDFQNTFGDRRATFQGLIIIGKDMDLSLQEKDRLKWRLDRTKIELECFILCLF